MKLLHTGDWHIGKVINDYSLLDDQRYILTQLFSVIESQQPDVIIITGDIYDRSIPPKEAVELLNDTLTRIIEQYNIPTLIISGNHDSQERLNFGSKLLEHRNLYIQGLLQEDIKKVTLRDDLGNVNFYLLPYAHPFTVRHLLNNEDITNHNQAFEALIKRTKLNQSERNVLITHNYLLSNSDDIILSESERSLSIGGAEYVDAKLVSDFDYVAIGHLHNKQKVSGNVLYSGSLLKYSFSEANREKGALLVELTSKNTFTEKFIKLVPKKDMRIIKGKLAELISPSYYSGKNCEDYILARLTDTTELYNPLETLRSVYPNIMQIERENLNNSKECNTKASSNFKKLAKLDLFHEFYENIMGNVLNNEKEEIIRQIITEAERDEESYENK